MPLRQFWKKHTVFANFVTGISENVTCRSAVTEVIIKSEHNYAVLTVNKIRSDSDEKD